MQTEVQASREELEDVNKFTREAHGESINHMQRDLESARDSQRNMMVGGRKRKLADYGPYEGAFWDDSEYEYDSRDDVYKGNVTSFTAKEVQKIKAKGVASFYNRKFKKWHCPYCTTKPKLKDGRFDHLLSHAEDVPIHGEDYKIRGQHAVLAKALTPT
ncbi:lrr receptor-like serine threonine-protein kinase [Hordeum vulgare]|nr:lrr receptor-like serine threonine-protein kinase [Hordeum vulgare]